MIFVSHHLNTKSIPDLEQQLAAYQHLTQSLSEEFDRASELQAQTVQTNWESWNLFCSDLGQIKNPQEFFLRSSDQAHSMAAQFQHYLQASAVLHQKIQEKMIAIGKAISPMMTESVVEIRSAPISTPSIDAKRDQANAKVIKDINIVEPTAVKTPIRSRRKPSFANTEVSTVETVTVTEVASEAPTPKARKVKPKETTTDAAPIETAAAPIATPNKSVPVKKSAVVGLPSKPAAKSGFAGAAGQPEFKPKSSKATGAKKRVRQ